MGKTKYIPGIFNYCDRWCERCAFTLRCRTYAMESKMRRSMDEGEDEEEKRPPDDESNAAFWEELDESYGKSEEALHDLVHDINFEFTQEELDEAGREHELQEERAQEVGGAVTQSAGSYAWKLREFFESNPGLDDVEALALQSSPGSAANSAQKGHAVRLWDALEIILWHSHFIEVKLHRAYYSLVSDLDMPEDMPSDADGTAKVVLIALDRCIAAWSVVQELMPEHAAPALDFMLRLARLRHRVEEDFPRARAFVRPGFDEE